MIPLLLTVATATSAPTPSSDAPRAIHAITQLESTNGEMDSVITMRPCSAHHVCSAWITITPTPALLAWFQQWYPQAEGLTDAYALTFESTLLNAIARHQLEIRSRQALPCHTIASTIFHAPMRWHTPNELLLLLLPTHAEVIATCPPAP
ncbi:hypothetical protein HYV74_02835 [Candidatus Uhrbacteria bacterium]|nr:hypothetical protein [Candidatus Uhrbacteria bacterium]